MCILQLLSDTIKVHAMYETIYKEKNAFLFCQHFMNNPKAKHKLQYTLY